MLADHLVTGRIVLNNLPYPLLGSLQSLLAAHVLIVEHYEQHISIFEEIAYSKFPFIAIQRICSSIPEELVGIPLVGTGHIVVVTVNSSPHIIFERLLLIQLLPKRVATSPGSDVTQMKHPIKRFAVLLHS